MPSSAAQSTKTRGSETGSVAVKPGVEWEEASYVYVQICLWCRRAALISRSSSSAWEMPRRDRDGFVYSP